MSNLKRLKIIIAVMFTVVLAACGEEDEQVVPLPQDVSVARFDSCVSGKGWIHVSSREVKQNGTLAKEEYWNAPDAGKPQQYFFGGDTLTTFLSTEAYNAEVYQVSRYKYKSLEHSVVSTRGEVFKLISVSPDELCIIQYKGFGGNGEKIYLYSVYRPMNAGELALCRREHPYNVATINSEFPTLPEQEVITVADFKAKAVNHGWKCTEAYRMETATRYAAKDLQKLKDMAVPDNFFLTADSIVSFKTGVPSNISVSGRHKYSFRANSFSLDTSLGVSVRILYLSADEMRLLLPGGSDGQRQESGLYCIYRKMAANEMATNGENTHHDTSQGS